MLTKTSLRLFYSILQKTTLKDVILEYIISSYFIFVEPFLLQQIQKRPNRKKRTCQISQTNTFVPYLLMCLVDEFVQVRHAPVGGVHGYEVRDAAAAVLAARGVEGRQPHAPDAHLPQVVELLAHAWQVARARAAARLVEGREVDAVEDGGLPPGEAGRPVEELLELEVEGEHGVEAGPEDGEGEQEEPFGRDPVQQGLCGIKAMNETNWAL